MLRVERTGVYTRANGARKRKNADTGCGNYVGSKLRLQTSCPDADAQIPRVRESQTDGLVNHAHIWICLVRGLTTISRQQQDSAIPKKDCRRGPRGFPGDHPSVSALRLGYAIWLGCWPKNETYNISKLPAHACCPWVHGITPSILPRGAPAVAGAPPHYRLSVESLGAPSRLGRRPVRLRASRKIHSTWPLALRISSTDHFSMASQTSGSIRSGYCLRAAMMTSYW